MKITLYQNDLPNNHKLESAKSVAIDAESLGLNYKGRDKLCLLQICSGDDEVYIIQFDRDKYHAPNLVKLLSNKNTLKIAHYARFEIGIIKHYLKIDLQNIYCTKIASKLCRTYTDKHGLYDITKELLGITLNKAQQSSDWGLQKLSEEQKQYAASDVIHLHQIKEKLDQMLVREGRLEMAKKCFAFLETRVELDLGGWEEDIFSH
ncbi:MAG: ribonuclease D [Pelagibacteraceae bacterium]|jgi:ribonuclease D|nr:ribonuclease D [Pelagibacteraceae bacterium]